MTEFLKEIISTSKINKTFPNNVRALEDFTFSVKKGEVLTIIGPSGSGKSTLIRCINRLEEHQRGRIIVDGMELTNDLKNIEKIRAEVGMVFQHFNLFEHLSVNENVTIPLIPSGLTMKEIHEKVDEALKVANIIHKQEILASRLSGGEKQRTAIARALVADPNIILCDEPTANLDRDNSLLFIDILEKLHQMGKTIVIATHDPLFDSLSFESTIVPMVDGKIV